MIIIIKLITQIFSSGWAGRYIALDNYIKHSLLYIIMHPIMIIHKDKKSNIIKVFLPQPKCILPFIKRTIKHIKNNFL